MAPTQPTFREHLKTQQQRSPALSGDLAVLLGQVTSVAKSLAGEVRRAALGGRLGLVGGRNVSGEEQKKLDVVANDLVVEAFSGTGLIAAIVSEELAEPHQPERSATAPYVLCVDPLDGSSNTDINGAVGTIFGLFRRRGSGPPGATAQSLPQGSDLVSSGYVLYGPSTLLAYTAGAGVFGFTLEDESGEFLMSHDAIRCPSRGKYYSANLGNQGSWHPNIQAYLTHLTERDPSTRRPYSLRYIGALAADLHRSLIDGGLYFYPPDSKYVEGKLRLLYECAPLAFLIEQAGGRASTGTGRVLDVETRALHQRCPLVIGSADEVALYQTFLKNGKPS